MKPFSPSNTSRGPVMPRRARNVVRVTAPAALGEARPFQLDSGPGRGTATGAECEGARRWGGRAPPPDRGAGAGAVNSPPRGAPQPHRLPARGADRARQGVEHANLELLARRLRQIVEGCTSRKPSQ